MTRTTRARTSAYNWRYILPGVAAPIGGGIIKVGQASTWAAVSVGLAPYVIVASLYAIFMIGYVPAVFCYLWSGEDRQDAINRLITTSADAIVSLITLTPTSNGRREQPSGEHGYRPRVATHAAHPRNLSTGVRDKKSGHPDRGSARQSGAGRQRAVVKGRANDAET